MIRLCEESNMGEDENRIYVRVPREKPERSGEPEEGEENVAEEG